MEQLPKPLQRKAGEEKYEKFNLFGLDQNEVDYLFVEKNRAWCGIYRATEQYDPDSEIFLTTDDFLYVIEGEMRFQFVDGQRLTLAAGNAIYLPAGSRFTAELVEAPYKQFFALTAPASSLPEVAVFPSPS